MSCGTGKVSLDEILGGAWPRNAYWKRIPDTLKIWDARLRDYLEVSHSVPVSSPRMLRRRVESGDLSSNGPSCFARGNGGSIDQRTLRAGKEGLVRQP